jgi:tRNA1Val (adenine37-N6)-methyltransferase
MPNNYFQFKEFIIQQEHCAMKVTTDACLFGAWLADLIKNEELKIRTALDIGTGTGLLSLMIAQQNNIQIDAVEIDGQAAMQAKENVAASPWKDGIIVHNTSIQQYNPSQQYDCIFTNPPFFENDLKSDDDKRNLALHSASLTLEVLLQNMQRLINAQGMFAILLPYHRTNYFEQLAVKNGFFLQQKTLVKQTEQHNYFRSMLLFTQVETATVVEEITIQQEDKKYTPAFSALLKDYYLYL